MMSGGGGGVSSSRRRQQPPAAVVVAEKKATEEGTAHRPWIDPYAQYHTERFAYGTRPTVDEPHVVLEYRELVPKLDKDVVRRLASGFYLPRKPEIDEPEIDVASLDAADLADLADAAAVARATASAAAAALDAGNKSGKIIDRLEEEDFNAKVAAVRKARRPDDDVFDSPRFSVDRVCLDPMDDDHRCDDDDDFKSVELNMANTLLSLKVHRHRCQIPRDYLDLQRHFVAQHPKQHRPLSIERSDGAVILPSEKHFVDGETIVFREFTLGPHDDTTADLQDPVPRDWVASLPPLPSSSSHDKSNISFDWERAYAEWARRNNMTLEDASVRRDN